MCSCFSVREIWWEEGQKDVPVVGVVVAGCVVLPGDGGHGSLPGDGGHGSLPGDCLGFHVGCVSYLEHCIIQLNSEFLLLYIYMHLGYSFTLYVLLYGKCLPLACTRN